MASTWVACARLFCCLNCMPVACQTCMPSPHVSDLTWTCCGQLVSHHMVHLVAELTTKQSDWQLLCGIGTCHDNSQNLTTQCPHTFSNTSGISTHAHMHTHSFDVLWPLRKSQHCCYWQNIFKRELCCFCVQCFSQKTWRRSCWSALKKWKMGSEKNCVSCWRTANNRMCLLCCHGW